METVAWIFRQIILCVDRYVILIFDFLKLFNSFYSRIVKFSDKFRHRRLFLLWNRNNLWAWLKNRYGFILQNMLSFSAEKHRRVSLFSNSTCSSPALSSAQCSAVEVEAMTKINRRKFQFVISKVDELNFHRDYAVKVTEQFLR